MESKDELKEIAIENCTYYHFDDIMGVIDIFLIMTYQMKNQIKHTIIF